MQRARSRDAARKNLAALGDELLQHLDVFVVDVFDFFDAELADALAAIEELLLAALLSARAALRAAISAGSWSWCCCHVRSPLLSLRPLGRLVGGRNGFDDALD